MTNPTSSILSFNISQYFICIDEKKKEKDTSTVFNDKPFVIQGMTISHDFMELSGVCFERKRNEAREKERIDFLLSSFIGVFRVFIGIVSNDKR